ncbi:MAG: helix-turn-helix transcriptional regulator [Verrucomicrobia bacterium]|nr:helix-turn-helix transcriptional regulator [Verrucomicrobiota bacterium]
MNYPVNTSPQLRAVLRGLRQSRALSQAQVGQLLGVNQKRAARIESAPGVTAFDQIARLVAALGGRLVVEMPDTPPPATPAATKKGAARKAAALAAKADQGGW